ncbi:hypothetical protein KFL_006080030 [Klebsormidium nitens]|uniref:FAD/NAD(P)-binding domain-containing protein n=1 Tax=Klebsormidium nitens TaxID=105231 RepID=A0A1Y1ING5_KLENI|nr:hypothetical protein KFL_006080030 [Klebsormidium nitens]|eukprot:GAQ90167.1 hypothetical protein KFL_006080030 [Klebsormidium nitens]
MAPEPEPTGADINTFNDTWQQQKAAPVADFAAWERALKADGKWPLQLKGQRTTHVATAVVKGAGPAGISAALELDKLGFHVVLVDCRNANARLNMIAVRAETNRRLHELGALKHLKAHARWARMARREIFDEWTQQFLEAEKAPVFFDAPGYARPAALCDQISTHYTSTADLETSLLMAVKDQAQSSATGGVKVVPHASIRVTRAPGTKRDRVTLVPKDASQPSVDLGCPDLVVWATGKRDPDLARDLGITQQYNVDLINGPGAPPLEPQAFLLFQLKPKTPASALRYMHTVLTKELCDAKPQKLIRGWVYAHGVLNCTIQLPCGLTPRGQSAPPDPEQVARHVVGQVNAEHGTSYASVDALLRDYDVTYGSISNIFWVDTSLASALTHGSNLVLAGDAGGTSSPGSGTGAATAIVSDSESVARLGAGLLARKRAKATCGAAAAAPKRAALMAQYARDKMDAILAWAKSARMYLVTQAEAEEIRGPLKKTDDLKALRERAALKTLAVTVPRQVETDQKRSPLAALNQVETEKRSPLAAFNRQRGF